MVVDVHCGNKPECSKCDGLRIARCCHEIYAAGADSLAGAYLGIHTTVQDFQAVGDGLRPLVRKRASHRRHPECSCKASLLATCVQLRLARILQQYNIQLDGSPILLSLLVEIQCVIESVVDMASCQMNHHKLKPASGLLSLCK